MALPFAESPPECRPERGEIREGGVSHGIECPLANDATRIGVVE